MKKVILGLMLLVMAGCSLNDASNWFFSMDDEGNSTAKEGESTPADIAGMLLGLVGGPIGIAGVAGIKLARKAERAKDAILDSNKVAIENGELATARGKKAIKAVLAAAQDMHPEADLIRSEYRKWKAKNPSDKNDPSQ